ncbi:hypothetical protein [uncultured Thiohalocapsa sp.]|uniref:hypothetical protein n=1 Tax=uncultured Thiohalocapsa sp. TaxID=768990 RepID=UPI0025D4E34E|nr:hypothetical protein [uncultured Thiohalocapsa sp.]
MQASLKQRLAMTTGAAAAAFGPAAVQGAVVYNNTSPITATFNTADNSHDWDVDGDNQADFRLVGSRYGYTTSYYDSAAGIKYYSAEADATVRLNSGGALVRQGGLAADFRALTAGLTVGPLLAGGYTWGASNTQRIVVSDATRVTDTNAIPIPYDNLSGSIGNNFQAGGFGNNFIGFRFDISGATHYGWAELLVDDGTGTGGRGDVTITRWAYEDTADCAIDVGQTSGDNCANDVPNPGTLALLAAGAAGLRRWRGRAKAA